MYSYLSSLWFTYEFGCSVLSFDNMGLLFFEFDGGLVKVCCEFYINFKFL